MNRYLEAVGVPFERTRGDAGESLRVAASPKLPLALAGGVTAAVGSGTETPLHLAHPLVLAAVDEARRATLPRSVEIELPSDAPEELARYAGQRGRLRVVKVLYRGFERLEQLVPIAVFGDGLDVLDPSLARILFQGTFRERIETGESRATGETPISDEVLEDATEELLFAVQGEVDRGEQPRYEIARQQAERFVEDRLLVLGAVAKNRHGASIWPSAGATARRAPKHGRLRRSRSSRYRKRSMTSAKRSGVSNDATTTAIEPSITTSMAGGTLRPSSSASSIWSLRSDDRAGGG